MEEQNQQTPINSEPAQNPSPVATPTSPTTPESPKKHFGKKWILIGVVLLLITLGGGSFVLSQQKAKPITIIPPSPTISQITKPTPNPTAEWKTYTNTKYGYTVRYPEIWQINVNGGADPATSPATYLESACNYNSGQICSQILVEIGQSDGKLEPSFIINQTYDKILSRRYTVLDNEPVQEIIYLAGNQGAGENKLYYILVVTHNNTKYTLKYEESAKNRHFKLASDWQNKILIDQILSTFKFTNSVKSSGTGISGKVLLGPSCPVQKDPPDEQCNDKPYQATIVVNDAGGLRKITEFKSNANGEFRVSLPPGQYLLESPSSLPPTLSPQRITVTEGKYLEIILTFDSGIR